MNESIVAVPVMLNAQTRAAFREEGLAALARLGTARGGTLVLDMTHTQRVDSAGLGTLVMLQLRAAEGRHSVRLKGVSETIRFLLIMSRLDDRFLLEPLA